MVIEKDKTYKRKGTQSEMCVVGIWEDSGNTYVQWYYTDSKLVDRQYPSHKLSDFVNMIEDDLVK
jgi:hypothetical protein